MGLIDLFQKTRETSMEMKPQEDEAAKVVTCKGCGAELKAYAYGKNLYVCPHCGRYGRLLARTRIRQIADKDSFEELYANLAPADPIHFPGYAEKTAELAEKVGMPDAVKTGVCKIGGVETAIGVMDSHFMMASMGSVVGEKLTRLFEYATITPQGVLFHDVTSIRLNESSVFEVRLPDGSLVNCADFLKLQ